MPLYEYECFLCGERFERIQRVSAEPVKECPKCGGRVRRLLGVPALQFKGSGWYVTDYGKGSAQSPAPEKASDTTEKPPAESKPSTSETTSSPAANSDSGSST